MQLLACAAKATYQNPIAQGIHTEVHRRHAEQVGICAHKSKIIKKYRIYKLPITCEKVGRIDTSTIIWRTGEAMIIIGCNGVVAIAPPLQIHIRSFRVLIFGTRKHQATSEPYRN